MSSMKMSQLIHYIFLSLSQYACENQSKEMVEALVNSNKNLIQLRNTETGAVPLHYAAAAGNLEIVKFLLLKRAPPMPRTTTGLFPRDFAEPNGEVAKYLDEYKAPISTLKNKWDHGTLDRNEAARLLYEKREELYEQLKSELGNVGENPYVNLDKEKDDLISGIFLVRLSRRNDEENHVITMLHSDNVIKNYRIERAVGFALTRQFMLVERKLIEFHTKTGQISLHRRRTLHVVARTSHQSLHGVRRRLASRPPSACRAKASSTRANCAAN